jgi:hypothetical protein
MASKGKKELGLLGLIKLERGEARPARPAGQKEKGGGEGKETLFLFFSNFPKQFPNPI